MLTPMKAIRAKCLDCCCGSSEEVKQCPSTDCPLYEYRFGHNPNIKLTDEQKARRALNLPNKGQAVGKQNISDDQQGYCLLGERHDESILESGADPRHSDRLPDGHRHHRHHGLYRRGQLAAGAVQLRAGWPTVHPEQHRYWPAGSRQVSLGHN